jgi:hypothetical protein
MNLKLTLLRRGLLVATVACAAWGTAPAHAVFSIDEAFTHSTAPGWTIDGGVLDPVTGWTQRTPQLTAGPGGDAEGNGWLRLTDDLLQSAMAVYDQDFPREEGLQITFDYAIYSSVGATGAGADGITLYLIDGNTATPTAGSHAGALGYSPGSLFGNLANRPGVTNGYVAIGLDEWGNFSNETGSTCTPSGSCPDRQSVVVRGAGNLNDPAVGGVGGFPVLHKVSLLNNPALRQIAPFNRPGRTVRITISPVSPADPYPKVTVEINPGSGFVKVIDAFPLDTNGPVPATFKLGFGAATGAQTIHEVRIKPSNPIPALGQSALGALAVLLVLLTLPALRRRFRN